MVKKKCIFCGNEKTQDLNLNYLACQKCINEGLQLLHTNSKAASKVNKENKDALKDYVIGFGKYRGKKIVDVEPEYIRWCLENFDGLRDIEIFQEALESKTGLRVKKPAAIKIKPIDRAMPKAEKIEKEEDTDFPF